MRRGRVLAAAGVAAFLLFLVAMLPAPVALRFLPPGLSLEGLEGSVWRGGVANASWKGNALGPIRWSNRPWRLPLLELNYAIEYGPPGQAVELDLAVRTRARVQLTNVRGRCRYRDYTASWLPAAGTARSSSTSRVWNCATAALSRPKARSMSAA